MNRVAALRVSLLVSLGIVPAACGGTTRSNPDEETGGASSSGGTASRAGSAPGGSRAAQAGATGRAGSAAQGGGPTVPTCTSPVTDPQTGLVTCDEGYRHRPNAITCSAVTTGPTPGGGGASAGAAPPRPPPADVSTPCANDPSVCAQFLYGFCSRPPDGDARDIPTCDSGCVTDDDCDNQGFCVCSNAQSPTGGVCIAAVCRTDHDCGAGFLCASYDGTCGGNGAFACQTAQDDCEVSADCPSGTCTWGFVGVGGGSNIALPKRNCGNNMVCGRPFLVEAAARLAPAVASSGWTTQPIAPPRLDHLTASERAALAAHWTGMGQMEHASIAAFARFSLQLLALGAPPELVQACTSALADETAHTLLCFQIASAYAGHAIGPGPLDVSGNLLQTSLTDIVDLVIAEGCFGETSAALEALEAADTAADPVIVAAYSQIAHDEQRHAELAFRFVRWALERGGQTVAARIRAAIARPPTRDVASLSVVVPCFEALLTRPAPAAARAPTDRPMI